MRPMRVPEDRRIVLRIGINLGDVMVEGSDLYGDGVNIAARLEALAEPGGVFVSGTVSARSEGKLDAQLRGPRRASLKNIAEPVRVYRVSGMRPTGAAVPRQCSSRRSPRSPCCPSPI